MEERNQKNHEIKFGYELFYNTAGKNQALFTPFVVYDTLEETEKAIKDSINFYKSNGFPEAKDNDFVVIHKKFS